MNEPWSIENCFVSMITKAAPKIYKYVVGRTYIYILDAMFLFISSIGKG